MNRGQALADAFGEALGIDSRWIFGCEADAHEMTVWRGIEASDGGPALLLNEDGTVTQAAMVAETFDLRRPT